MNEKAALLKIMAFASYLPLHSVWRNRIEIAASDRLRELRLIEELRAVPLASQSREEQ